ncbi:MAG: hypothetical protein GOMPHAMPRED_006600 [Gomphillus americanus]|uniref:3-carboxymuconate cyclase n=1 Tax=Gomphillus americanus TaxID=1940652 RepID=A0A8H3IYG1_9LECA|nr:MAG: hypothetical protein GOMPHAMPRED_006600 [Gomphillus americanus]
MYSKAIYISTNQGHQNSIVALAIQKDGTLVQKSVTASGGAGAAGIDSAINAPSGPDALFSQSALTVAGKHLFAVNAGSNSLSMFKIHSATNLTLINTIDLPGEFPVTVGASEEHKLVCAGMSGAVAGVACSKFSAKGLAAADALRPFDIKQTTPPVGPLNTVSQVFFTSTHLFATVKGDPTKNNTGFLASFPIYANKVSSCGDHLSPPGTAVLFGAAPINETHIFSTDASFGAAALDLSRSNNNIGVQKALLPDQKATCWTSLNQDTQTAFVTDVGIDRIVEMSFDAKILNIIDMNNGDPGLIDLQAAGQFVYALSPGNDTVPTAIAVLDAKAGKQIQHLVMAGVLDKNAQGLAILKKD